MNYSDPYKPLSSIKTESVILLCGALNNNVLRVFWLTYTIGIHTCREGGGEGRKGDKVERNKNIILLHPELV